MKNYKDSDYAANKLSPNIVYRFADGTVEVTLEDYLQNNPDKTEQDFVELKALSDEIYHEQIIVTNRTSRLDVTINDLEGTTQLATSPLDVELLGKHDEQKAMAAAQQLLDSGTLTDIQRRRFILHYFKGLSIRQIGVAEDVDYRAVWDSIHWATKKLKKIFKK